MKVQRLTVSVSEGANTEQLAMEGLARHRCNRVLQIANDVSENAGGRYFGFIVNVMRMVPSISPAGEGVVNTTAQGEYTKSYRFPRTKEVLETFDIGQFAFKVYEDMAASGVLDAMR